MEEEMSIFSAIGADIVGVMSPVSICMVVVVILIYSSDLPSSSSQTVIRTAANLVYEENPSDSVSQKIEGSLLNAAVFITLIAAVTFLLVILYYYNFTSCLTNYMRFSSFLILSSLGGSVFVSLLRQLSIPADALTAALLIFNFSAVGASSLFSHGFPIVLRQAYLVAIAVIVAAWFSRLPEWTTWSLLLSLSLYDLAAVLLPGGPLRLLVELASSRGDDNLPALVYEARPSQGTTQRSVELQPMESSATINEMEDEQSPLVASPSIVSIPMEMERGIKLGLGDFIFYSVLVGRAAMYDLMTVYACYLAIISGLACTLHLLSFYRKALPALPISIALGTLFYFLTRLIMEPLLVGASTNLLMF